MSTLSKQKRIAIIGAGPGGLMLALLLQRRGLQPVVYERAPHDLNAESGGSLDIHEESGQKALRDAGLYEKFSELARYGDQDFRVLDNSGTFYIDETADDENPGDRPEIDRGILSKLILESLDTSCIRYGHQLEEAVPLDNGSTQLRFANGAVEEVDLLVGADGAFSRVRALLSDTEVEYSGVTMVELHIPEAAKTHPDLAEFNKRGKMFAMGDHKCIIGQLNGDGRIRVYVSLQVQQDWLETCGIPFDQPTEAKRRLLDLFHDWDERVKNYIRCAEDTILPRRIYMLPIGYTWERRPGVTLIGDAAHLMSPFAGEGVNLALLDAAELANAIHEQKTIAEAVASYEQNMYAYSSEKARQSDESLRLCFSDNAAAKLSEMMSQFEETPPIVEGPADVL
ncbi:FAD-dependent oxidoreductase [Tumebacillus flagellatus]|uniref:Flavin-dependent monooxygenase n=1 Tax=Tumebacillus flagellatus TaxID=1157490 RepID=A0A074MAX0_9BACL|nr:NAD(P)/FAD-dependent oxidoreductase [Tumebacillus flagellatus]KEO83062.1 tetracycline resistance protein [Tumebacillus flagellatus]